MSITLSNLKIKLNFALGTSETNLMTNEKRVDAINRAIQIILEQYPVPQYVVNTLISFTNGQGDLPTDCLNPLKLSDPTNNFNVFIRTNWDNFQNKTSFTYDIEWLTSGNKEVINIFPTSYTSLTFWYIQNAPLLVNDGDVARFNSFWQDAIAEKAAEVLLTSSAQFDRAQAKQEVADNLIAKAWQLERLRIEGPENSKLTSVFSQKKSLLNYRSTVTSIIPS